MPGLNIPRRFDYDAPLKSGLLGTKSNPTKIARSSSHVELVCPVCGTGFTRKGSEAKRHAVNYCGRACAGFGSRRQVLISCRMCEIKFTVKQCHVGVVTCCSFECKRKAHAEEIRKRLFATNGRLLPIASTDERSHADKA